MYLQNGLNLSKNEARVIIWTPTTDGTVFLISKRAPLTGIFENLTHVVSRWFKTFTQSRTVAVEHGTNIGQTDSQRLSLLESKTPEPTFGPRIKRQRGAR